MKKILVFAMMALYAVSAFALDAKFEGLSEIKGKYFMNGSATKKHNNDQALYFQKLRFWATLNVDDNTSIHLRSTPNERVWGAAEKDGRYNDTFKLDRAYVTLTFGALAISGGKIEYNDFYAVTFGTLHKGRGEGAGSADGIKVAYSIDNDMKVMGYVVKDRESQLGVKDDWKFGYNGKNTDMDSYVLAADLKFGDVRVTPSLGYQKDLALKDHSRFSYHVSAIYDVPELEVQFAVAGDVVNRKKDSLPENFDDMTDEQQEKAKAGLWLDNEMTYGAMLQGAYKTADMKVGALFAYASADKKKGNFSFGDDFDKTIIVDNQYFSGNGATGMWSAQAFAEYKVNPDLMIDGRVAYYKSNLDKNNNKDTHMSVLGMNDKSAVLEFDVNGTYQLTKKTSVKLSAAYAVNTDLYNIAENKALTEDESARKAKDVMALRWVLKTVF